ncbi:putative receptor-like protein kinase At2g30940 [Bidens hawaiensis]|uniref:putative receptor-like protein kinase At2g30940 n=1 Tax=Bidens hawaiensis TaxID=980011 RepID=UPI00404A7AA3
MNSVNFESTLNGVPECDFQSPIKSGSRQRKQKKQQQQIKKLEHLKIPLADIKLATDDFSEKYQISSFDGVTLYRAELDDHVGKENHSSVEETVVIKRYPFGHNAYKEVAFFTEIEMLSSVKHPNIVTLLGFCVEDSEMILVTENVSNGYLFNHLGNVDRMRIFTWEKRLKIVIDVAHALKYLHNEMEDQKINEMKLSISTRLADRPT